jgi:hypothetical protein
MEHEILLRQREHGIFRDSVAIALWSIINLKAIFSFAAFAVVSTTNPQNQYPRGDWWAMARYSVSLSIRKICSSNTIEYYK